MPLFQPCRRVGVLSLFQLATLNGRTPETGVILDSKPAAVWKLRFPMDERYMHFIYFFHSFFCLRFINGAQCNNSSSLLCAFRTCNLFVHFALATFVCISHLHLLCTFRTCTFCVHSALAHLCAFRNCTFCVHSALAIFVCISPGHKHCFSIDW